MSGNQRLLGCASFAATALTAALLVLSVQTTRAQSASNNSSASQAQSQDASKTANTSAAKPNLAGTWTLNQKQSDDPRQKMQEAMNANGDQGDSGGGGGRMGGRRGRGGQGGGMMMRQFSQLTITQTDKGLNVTGATGRLVATTEPQSSDQNAQDNQDNGGGRGMMRMQPAQAKWQGSQLVATSDMFGGTTTRTFELSPDGKQLYMTTKIENQRFSQPVTYRFVYDPGKSGDNSQ
ncbi:MAG TPA: hypothetical protein VMF66_05315 [Candidatus Acidoferrum sp.]|nr:hypothetical protein [Candidatus Acidoferrum sp.]